MARVIRIIMSSIQITEFLSGKLDVPASIYIEMQVGSIQERFFWIWLRIVNL